MKKFLSILRQNIGLKLLSLLVAVVIWYAVVDVNDPVETGSYSVKVSVANESYIANGKRVYYIDDDYKTVTVFIKANRSTLRNVSADDITVTADLTQIVDLDSDPIMVPLSAECSKVTQTAITLSRSAIPITIEEIAEVTLPITVDTGDSEPSQEYEVGTTTANPNQITISGAESIVNQIETAYAQIDVNGMTRDSSKTATLVLVDKDAEEISEDTMTDDLMFEGSDEVPEITVYVELWKKQSDVALEVDYGGTPAEDYHVESVTVTPETISVAGSTEALAGLAEEGNTLTIGPDLISVDGAGDTVTAEINLADILPDNMKLTKTTSETATVTITILSDETKELTLDVDDIEVKNLASDLTISYGQTSITVRVKGSGSTISRLTASDLTASIDLNGLSAGESTVPVTFTLPDGVTLDEDVTITVTLKETAGGSSQTDE